MTYVAVTGGRDYQNAERARAVLDAAVERLGLTSGVDGHAPGLDLIARTWASERGIPWRSIKAEWNRYGYRAGPIRNGVVLKTAPDIVLAFPGGDGTADMIRQTEAAIRSGAPIRLILIDRE